MPILKVPSTLLFGEPFVMSADTKHPEEAWLFYKWMINPNSVLGLYSSGLWIVKEWYEKPELIAKWAGVKPADALQNDLQAGGFKVKSMSVLRRRENQLGWLFAAPAIIGFLVFRTRSHGSEFLL